MRETVVLIPGLQSDRNSWMFQLAHLRDRYDVIVPEGHQALGTIRAMAQKVLEQVPERFHLVAWSMGGYVALDMLPHLKGRLLSFVMICTSARPEDPANTERRMANLEAAEKEGLAAAHMRTMAFSCIDYASLDAGVRETLRTAAVALGKEAYRAQQFAIIERPDGRLHLPLVDCPALIMVGEGDRVTPPDRSEEIHAAIPGSDLRILEGCAHCPPLECPDKVNELLSDWLVRHGGAAKEKSEATA